MSRWIDRVEQHSIWGVLASVFTSISNARARADLSTEMVDSIERIHAVVKFGEARLSATDPVLIPPQALENLIPSLNQLIAHVESFAGNGDLSQLNSANAQADTLLVNLNLFLGVATPPDVKAIAEATTSYRQALEKHLSEAMKLQVSLLDRAEANDSKIKTIEAALTTEQQRLSSLLSEQQTQFSTAQDKRATDFAAIQADYLAKYTASISEQKTQFSTDQDARRTTFSDFQRENQEKLTTLLSSYDQKLKDNTVAFEAKEKQADEANKKNLQQLQEKYEEQALEILREIDKHKSDVESLVGVIGNLGVTSGYKKVADYARRSLVFWQSLTLVSLAGLIFVALMAAFPGILKPETPFEKLHQTMAAEAKVEDGQTGTGKNTTEKNRTAVADAKAPVVTATKSNPETDFYQGFLTRVFLSITFGIFAAYSGKQASRFFEMEQKNRKLALELEALGPFIEPLEKTERDKFRVQIGDRSFGVPDSEPSKTKDEDPVTALSLLKSKEIGEFISNIVKAAKS